MQRASLVNAARPTSCQVIDLETSMKGRHDKGQANWLVTSGTVSELLLHHALKDLGLTVPLILGKKLMERGGHLEHVSILEGSAASCLHPHLRLLALPIVWAVVQVLGLDEIQALSNLGRLKLDKVQVACGIGTHLFTSACLF